MKYALLQKVCESLKMSLTVEYQELTTGDEVGTIDLGGERNTAAAVGGF